MPASVTSRCLVLSCLISERSGMARDSKGITQFCLKHTNHTCLYSPAAEHHHPLAGTHCAYPRRDGQAELTWLAGLYTEIGFRDRELNPFVKTNALPLTETASNRSSKVHCCRGSMRRLSHNTTCQR